MNLVKEGEPRNLWQRARTALETVVYKPQSPTLPYVRSAEECLAELLPADYQAEAQKRAARSVAFQGLEEFAQPRQATDFLPSGLSFIATSDDAQQDEELARDYLNLVANTLQAGGTRGDIANVVGVGRVFNTGTEDAVSRNNLRLNGHV